MPKRDRTDRPSRRLLSGLFAAVIGFAPVAAAAAGDYPPIGPLPERAAPKDAMVAMGKRLFFDARISGDGGVSCATCHDPQQGFGKSVDLKGAVQRLSIAYPGASHFRNAPTLINTVYKADFANVGWSWDGHMGANLNDVIRNEITAYP